MFTSLNDQVAAGFKKGNDAIKEAYDAVKDLPTQFKNGLASAKSWVLVLPTITTSSRGASTIDSTILMSFPTMTLENPAPSSPSASAPSFSAGTAYPAASKHGPVSVAGNVTFSNGQIVMQTFSGEYAISNHELHVGYSKALRDGECHVTSGAIYRNTEFANITLMADYGYDSKV